jgi:hypothetical protein
VAGFVPICFTGCACCASTNRRCGRAARTSKFSRMHVLHRFRRTARKIIGFTPSAIEAMYSYAWTGNVARDDQPRAARDRDGREAS